MAERPELRGLPPGVAVGELASTGEVAVGVPEHGHIPGRERAERIRSVLVYLVLTLIAILFAVPFLWSVLTSLKPLSETLSFTFLPKTWTVAAYHSVFTEFSFGRYTLNSFIVAAAVTVSNLLLASIGGYAFARLRFPGREVLFLLVLATLMIPDQLRLVPVFLMLIDFPVTHWNLISTYQGYIAINLVMAANLFLMRQYFLTIPKDYEEAAKLDGAGYFKTYWRVMLPLSVPALSAVAILTFQGIWNEFFWALIILGFDNPALYTVQLGLTQFQFQYQTLWPELMAATTLAILPVVVVFVVFQRYFIAGMTAAGVKG